MPRNTKKKKTLTMSSIGRWLPKNKRSRRSVIFGIIFLVFILLTSAVAIVLAQRSQDIRNQAAYEVFCGGCINAVRPGTKTCNAWIDEECKQQGCGGDGVFLGAGESCCPGLVHCGNGRCGRTCIAPGASPSAPVKQPSVNTTCRNHAVCGPGFYCQTLPGNSQAGHCVSRVTNLSRCSGNRVIDGVANAMCNSGNCLDGVCVSSRATGRCEPSGAAGDAQCQDGSFCNDNGVCIAGRSKNADCSRSPQCQIGLACIDKKCQPTSSCSPTSRCLDDRQVCANTGSGGVCEFRAAFNAPCHRNTVSGEDTCYDGTSRGALWCYQGLCTDEGKRSPNAVCENNPQCPVGYGCFRTSSGSNVKTCQGN